jgi:hypothetical protein
MEWTGFSSRGGNLSSSSPDASRVNRGRHLSLNHDRIYSRRHGPAQTSGIHPRIRMLSADEDQSRPKNPISESDCGSEYGALSGRKGTGVIRGGRSIFLLKGRFRRTIWHDSWRSEELRRSENDFRNTPRPWEVFGHEFDEPQILHSLAGGFWRKSRASLRSGIFMVFLF